MEGRAATHSPPALGTYHSPLGSGHPWPSVDLLLPMGTGRRQALVPARAGRSHVTEIVTAPVTRALEFHSHFYQHRYSWRAPLLGMK